MCKNRTQTASGESRWPPSVSSKGPEVANVQRLSKKKETSSGEAEKKVRRATRLNRNESKGINVLMVHLGACKAPDKGDADGSFEATECLLNRYHAANVVPCVPRG